MKATTPALLLATCMVLTACTGAPSAAGAPSGTATHDAAQSTPPSIPPSVDPTPAATPVDASVAAGLAFIRPADGRDQVFVIDADGSPRQVSGLSGDADPGAARPLWSPDRTKIAFGPPTIGSGLDPQLWVVNADGSGQRPLADLGESTDWSPDSSRLVFCDSVFTTDNTGQPARIWISDVATGETAEVGQGTVTQWRPDGEAISFHPVDPPDPQGVRSRIVLMPLDGGGAFELGEGSGGWWAPDGSGVLLVDDGQLVLREPDGANPRPLVEGDSAVWSPDSTRIAYSTVDAVGTFQVNVITADGDPVWSEVPGTNGVWSPDGTKLAVEVGFPDIRIQILDAATGEAIWDLDGRFPDW
jgi:Tol biopolymer transport system component